jgi:hypothetical protein
MIMIIKGWGDCRDKFERSGNLVSVLSSTDRVTVFQRKPEDWWMVHEILVHRMHIVLRKIQFTAACALFYVLFFCWYRLNSGPHAC